MYFVQFSNHVAEQTVRLDLSTFYPFLAALAEMDNMNSAKPIHPALLHKVLNNVNPGTRPYELLDGSAAKLLVLGDEMPQRAIRDPNSMEWWPSAMTIKVLSKMRRRIIREGYALQICLAICTALVSEMYMSPVGDEARHKRYRLRYRTSSITDFGICNGSANVKNQDKLAYWFPDGELRKGQDPDDHYWMYFKTARGEEFILDCAMFTFNFCMVAVTDAYLPFELSFLCPFAPVYFEDRFIQKIRSSVRGDALHKERRRVSILRNPKMHELLKTGEFTPEPMAQLCELMEEIAGRKCTPVEHQLVEQWAKENSFRLACCLDDESYKRFPSEPQLAIEQDPGELDKMDDEVEDWKNTMKRWKRENKTKKALCD